MKMKKLLILISALLFAGTAIAATFDISKPVALFETTLAGRITSSDTTMTLTSAIVKDGSTLASTTYGFIIDEGTASEEFVLADCTATACTNMTRGVSALTGTSSVTALKKEHRRGASVKITDAPILLQLYNIIAGLQNIVDGLNYNSDIQHATTSNALVHANWVDDRYVDLFTNETVTGVKTFVNTPVLNAGATISSGQTINMTSGGVISGLATPTSGETTKAANVGYVNSLVSQGAATATDNIAGISRLSAAAVDANDPIVVGDNDPRLGTPISFVSTTSLANMATATLRNIPFGTSTKIIISVASTSAQGLRLCFNEDWGGCSNLETYHFTSDSAGTNLEETYGSRVSLGGRYLSGSRTTRWYGIFDLLNSTSTAKRSVGNYDIASLEFGGAAGYSNFDNVHIGFQWATTTQSINSVSVAVISTAGTNYIGAGTTISAYVLP